MASRGLYGIIGLACGFALIDYGFNILAVGLPGARELTGQFVGINLLIGGSAVAFGSLYTLLKPAAAKPPSGPAAGAPDVGVELITDEKETGPGYGFYKNIEYIGYFFTLLGLVSAADLVLQVFIPTIYNETRFWVEILLVVFGVLSYAIFGSIGRLGAQETRIAQPTAQLSPESVSTTEAQESAGPSYSDVLEVRLAEFSKSETGELERHLSGKVYDMVRIESSGAVIWREDRMGLRSVYVAGPYELSWKMLEDQVSRGEELRIGSLLLPLETIRTLLSFQASGEGISSPATI